MTTAEQNYLLLQEIEANRRFLLMAYQQNPKLLERAEARIRELIEMPAHGADNNLSSVLCPLPSERGISLIELIMFIVIVSVALAGILLVMNVVTKNSADPLVHKQALAIAESLLEEIELMPFTYCDPDDANAATATAATAAQCPAAGGVGGVEALGPETLGGTETRYATPNFDNVNDYNGCQMNTGVANSGCDSTGTGGIKDITNTAIAALSGYSATVAVAGQGIPAAGTFPAISAAAALLITVTVTGPDNLPVVLEGYRTRFAPNGLP